MNKSFTLITIVILFFGMNPTSLSGQMIWPGDIDNNGRVSGIDLLYLGTKFWTSGPERPNASNNWVEQPMGTPWNSTLPGISMNTAYADANGDGYISDDDITDGIINNYGQIHGQISEVTFPPIGQEGIHPPLEISSQISQASPGTQLQLDINLGSEAFPVQHFFGISFKINYDPTLVEGGITFEKSLDAWIDPQGGGLTRQLVKNDSGNGVIEITIARIIPYNLNGFGNIGNIAFTLIDDPDLVLPASLNLTFTDIMLVDLEMNQYSLLPQGTSINVTGSSNNFNCPDVIAPVCGANGITYINSCYAEAAGVTEYSDGVCFGDCIDPEQIDPDADCGNEYDPVCGCNGISYINACVAEAAGVSNYTSGSCSSSCFDPNYIVTSDGTAVDEITGVITLECSEEYDPVCGCNGVTYQNACLAEASGITFYTQGVCDDVCIDAENMNPDAICVTDYDPVCGCNNVTYSNSCYAEAAGVLNYTYGVCGSGSSWCQEAVPIQCGDFLAYETTVGMGNQIQYYPGCSNSSFQGPEKVYMLTKTTAGDLQIGLEIMTPGLDLDLFLLADNCSQLTCLESSTTSNSNTNNEGILLENAPLGTYYIVVDGQYASSEGDYRIEVNCGYLYCGDAQPLECGVPFQGNNMYGNDDVSLYGCDGNVMNVENNGPEMVHYFTTTEAGQVTIDMTGLTANLELFLLRSCDRGDCIDYSQNSGTNDESISAWLEAGTYYVVVDGYNGGVGDYILNVDCSSSCDFEFTEVSSTPTGCGQNYGSIHVLSSGGTPGFIIHYSGPVSGSFYTYSNDCTIYNLPAGDYTITKTDALGCSVSESVTVNSSGNLDLYLETSNVVCMDMGSVGVWITNGVAPFNILVLGPENANLTSYTATFDVENLPSGDYTIYVTDANGCSVSQTFEIGVDSGNFYFEATSYPGSCGGLGYIHIETFDGIPSYTILLSGPVSGITTTNYASFNIINLPAGTYTITIEDGNWCIYTEVVVVGESNLDVSATAIDGICGDLGSILLDIDYGTAPYNISWNGPVNGSTTTNNDNYTLDNLPSGTYQILVEDANWCSDYVVVQVNNSGEELTLNAISIDGVCNQPGGIWLDILGGSSPYNVSWTGPVSGSTTINNNGMAINDLPGGTYWVHVTDANGCTGTVEVTVVQENQLQLSLSSTNADCGYLGSIFVYLSNGTGPYSIMWSGPASGTVVTNETTYEIPDLPPGEYSIWVTDANGCSADNFINILSTEDLDITAIAIDGECGEDGSIHVGINGGAPTFTVSWSGPVSGSITTNNSFYTITNLPSGTYYITVVDANGCFDNQIVTLNNGEGGIDINTTLVVNDCGQYNWVWIDIIGGWPTYTITWTGPESGSGTTETNGFEIIDLPPGVYTITVTDIHGCTTYEVVTIYDAPVELLTLTGIDGECGELGTIIANVIDGIPDYQITWTGPVSGSITTSSTTHTINNLPSGTYTFTLLDGNWCTDVETVTINNGVDDLDINTTLVANDCGQYNWVWIDIIGGWPTYTITWTGPQNGSGTTETNGFEIIDLPPGVYTITVTDIHGCTAYEVITIYDAPVELLELTAINGECGTYGTIIATVTDGAPDYQISWTGPVSGSVTTSNATHVIQNLPSGTYTVTLLDGNWCTDVETITINNSPNDLDITTTLVINDCGQYNWVWIDITGGWPTYTITWTGPQNGSGTTETNGFEIIDLPPGVYIITITDIHGCSVSETVTIYDAPVELLQLTANNGDCNDLGSITATVIDGIPTYEISWTGPVSGSVSTDNPTYEIENLPSGTYTVSLLDGNWCTDVETITIYNTGGDLNIVAVAVNGTCEQNGSIWLDIYDGTAPYTVTWTGPSSGSITIDANGYNIPNLPQGNYTVTVTDANGCTDTTVVYVSVSENDLDAIAVPFDGDCDEAGYIHVGISGGAPNYIVNWSGPVNGSVVIPGPSHNIMNLPAGTYTITVTDSNGCTDVEVVTINSANTGLNVSSMPSNGYCNGLGSIWMDFYNGEAPYTITWTGPVSGSDVTNLNLYDIINLPSGTYLVTVTDANGCTYMETFTIINVVDDLTATLSTIPGGCGVPGTIQVSIIGGSPEYTISWTGGNSSGSITTSNTIYNIQNLPSAVYTVSIEDSNGCGEITSIQLLNYPNNLQVYTTPVHPTCTQAGAIGLVINGGTPNYDISWTGPVSGSTTVSDNNYVLSNLPGGNYTININDANDCYTVLNVSLDESTDTPMVDFNYSLTGLTVNFTNLSAAGSYFWTFGDGTSSTDANPTHAYTSSGSYEVCLTVTNNCGTATYCETIGVASGFDAVILDIGEAYGGPGSTVYIPVIIQNCELLVSLAGSMDIIDDAVGNISGISPGIITPQLNVNNGTFNFYDNTGEGIPVENGDTLFYFMIDLTGSVGMESELMLTNNPLFIEVGGIVNDSPIVLPHITVPGSVEIMETGIVGGNVSTYWGAGVEDVQMQISSSNMSEMEMTDENGIYHMPNLPVGQMYTFDPSKDNEPANGLSTYALFIGQRFILGLAPPQITSPYQVIAGDANCSGSFTTLDLFIIQQLIIGASDNFDQCSSWVFVSENYQLPGDFNTQNVFPYQSETSMMVMYDTTANFIGVKVGDILGQADPNNLQEDLDERNDNELIFTTDNQQAAAGTLIDIPVTSSNFEDIVSFQMGIALEAGKLDFVDFLPGDNPELSTLAAAFNNGEIRISWFNNQGTSTTISTDEVLFTLRLEALENIDNLSQYMTVSDHTMASEAHDVSGEAWDVVLEFNGVTSTNGAEYAGFKLFQNEPNPFTESTTIRFTLPAAMDAELIIHDSFGRTIRHYNGQFSAGQNSVVVDDLNLNGGVYFYSLKAGEFIATRDMVILK